MAMTSVRQRAHRQKNAGARRRSRHFNMVSGE